jgi:RHS repeat-associated protein
MTSDGANSYAWDAENRMIKITYPGTGNYSAFSYDGLGRNVSIVETTSGSVTSTKMFVWCSDKLRRYKPCEQRDASSNITAQFFDFGETISSSKYFWEKDQLGSVREMTDNSGTVQAEYTYDPYGRVTKVRENMAPDFGFGNYYTHSRSSLNLTLLRAYSSNLGRWLSRDPIDERISINLFGYVNNDPSTLIDPSGLKRAKAKQNPFFCPPPPPYVPTAPLYPGGPCLEDTRPMPAPRKPVYDPRVPPPPPCTYDPPGPGIPPGWPYLSGPIHGPIDDGPGPINGPIHGPIDDGPGSDGGTAA